MNYKEARVYLDQVSKYGSVLGLDNMRELLNRLGNPQNDLKFIHISGTNGKGSVLAYLSTILSGAGYRVGRYLSPTLFSYREKIQVDGEKINKESLAAHVTAIAEATRDMQEKNAGTPTVFEVETVLAILYFKEKHCDLVVLETGMGGLLDATNIISTTVLEVLTSISMDHMEFLGNTLAKIAEQKAGIIKPHTSVVSAKQEMEAEQVIREVCDRQECSLRSVDPEAIKDVHYGCGTQSFSYKNWTDVKISLAGSYQIWNASLALEAAWALQRMGYNLTEQQIRDGLQKTTWRGRFTIIQKEPYVIMDGAHNPAAAQTLRDSLQIYFPGRRLHYVFGMFQDKDYPAVIALTAPLAEHIITVETPDNPRALPAKELAQAVAEVNPSVEAAASIREAVHKSLQRAGKDDVVVIFGSLSYLCEAEQAVESYQEEKAARQE